MQTDVFKNDQPNQYFSQPHVLIIDDQSMSSQLVNTLFLRTKHTLLTRVTDIKCACDVISDLDVDYIILNKPSHLDKINGFLNANPMNAHLQGIIWLTSAQELQFNQEILKKVRVYLMDSKCDTISETIELVAHGWNGTSH